MRGAPPPPSRRGPAHAGALALVLGTAPLLAACAQDGAAQPVQSDVAGTWTLEGPRTGTMTLARAGDHWDVVIVAGGDPVDGAGVAADCEAHARGTLRDGRIDAAVVPFESDIMSVSAADLEASPARVSVEFDGDTARVRTDFAGCGIGAELGGIYRRGA